MRKTKLLAALAAFCLLFYAVSCQEPQQTADLKVTLSDNPRTLVPRPSDFKVTSYNIVCSGENLENPVRLTTTRTSCVIQGLPIGTYTIEATGLNDSNSEIVRGSTQFSLSQNNTSAIVVLSQLIGNGNLDIDFSWDGNLAEDAEVRVTLTAQDGQDIDPVEETIPAEGSSVNFSRQGLPAGSYMLVAELYSGATKIAGCVEAVRIGNNATVDEEITFNLDELTTGAGEIVIDNQSGTPVSCQVEGLEDGQVVQAQEMLEVSLDVKGFSEDELDISWHLDGSYLSSGTIVEITPQPGQHRLDVIASTGKKGSTGSTSIKFEAALMGAPGLPVIGSQIIESEVSRLSLSDDMVMDFTSDGSLIIVDNESKTLQVCDILRNTLRVSGTQNLDHPIDSLAPVSGTDYVAMNYEDTMETVVYSYNPNTKLLQSLHSNNGSIVQGVANVVDFYGIGGKNAFSQESFALLAAISPDAAVGGGSMKIASITIYDPSKSEDNILSRANLNQNFSGTIDITSIPYYGNDFILIDRETGNVMLWYAYEGKARQQYGTIDFSDVTAVSALPSGLSNRLRFVVADGDDFRFFEAGREDKMGSGFRETKDSVDRKEGSGLETVKLLLSRDERYLYALNQGNNTVSAYNVSSSGILSYIGSSELPFCPADAILSPDGNHMIIEGTGNSELVIMRIKTTE